MKTTENRQVTEFPKKVRKSLLIGLGIYVAGWLVMATIGESINRDSYVFSGFLAPFLVIAGLLFLSYTHYKDDHPAD